jgi:hypothetical protein
MASEPIFRFLLGIAPATDLIDAKIGMRPIAQTNRGRGARHLFLRDDMLKIAQAQTAKFLIHGDAMQTQFPHGGPEFAREPVLLVNLCR